MCVCVCCSEWQTCLAMDFKTVANPGWPKLSSGGKYVPPVNGSSSGVKNTLIGQPPPP